MQLESGNNTCQSSELSDLTINVIEALDLNGALDLVDFKPKNQDKLRLFNAGIGKNIGESGRILQQTIKEIRENQQQVAIDAKKNQEKDFADKKKIIETELSLDVQRLLSGESVLDSKLETAEFLEVINNKENWSRILGLINLLILERNNTLKECVDIVEIKAFKQNIVDKHSPDIIQLIGIRELILAFKTEINFKNIEIQHMPIVHSVISSIAMRFSFDFSGIKSVLSGDNLKNFDEDLVLITGAFCCFNVWLYNGEYFRKNSQKKITEILEGDKFFKYNIDYNNKNYFIDQNKSGVLDNLEKTDLNGLNYLYDTINNDPLNVFVEFIEFLETTDLSSPIFHNYVQKAELDLMPESFDQAILREKQNQEKQNQLLQACIKKLKSINDLEELESILKLIGEYKSHQNVDKGKIISKIIGISDFYKFNNKTIGDLIIFLTTRQDELNTINQRDLNKILEESKEQLENFNKVFGEKEFQSIEGLDYEFSFSINLTSDFRSKFSSYCEVNKTDLTFKNKFERLLTTIQIVTKENNLNIQDFFYEIKSKNLLAKDSLVSINTDNPKYRNCGVDKSLEYKLDSEKRIFVINSSTEFNKIELVMINPDMNGLH